MNDEEDDIIKKITSEIQNIFSKQSIVPSSLIKSMIDNVSYLINQTPHALKNFKEPLSISISYIISHLFGHNYKKSDRDELYDFIIRLIGTFGSEIKGIYLGAFFGTISQLQNKEVDIIIPTYDRITAITFTKKDSNESKIAETIINLIYRYTLIYSITNENYIKEICRFCLNFVDKYALALFRVLSNCYTHSPDILFIIINTIFHYSLLETMQFQEEFDTILSSIFKKSIKHIPKYMLGPIGEQIPKVFVGIARNSESVSLPKFTGAILKVLHDCLKINGNFAQIHRRRIWAYFIQFHQIKEYVDLCKYLASEIPDVKAQFIKHYKKASILRKHPTVAAELIKIISHHEILLTEARLHSEGVVRYCAAKSDVLTVDESHQLKHSITDFLRHCDYDSEIIIRLFSKEPSLIKTVLMYIKDEVLTDLIEKYNHICDYSSAKDLIDKAMYSKNSSFASIVYLCTQRSSYSQRNQLSNKIRKLIQYPGKLSRKHCIRALFLALESTSQTELLFDEEYFVKLAVDNPKAVQNLLDVPNAAEKSFTNLLKMFQYDSDYIAASAYCILYYYERTPDLISNYYTTFCVFMHELHMTIHIDRFDAITQCLNRNRVIRESDIDEGIVPFYFEGGRIDLLNDLFEEDENRFICSKAKKAIEPILPKVLIHLFSKCSSDILQQRLILIEKNFEPVFDIFQKNRAKIAPQLLLLYYSETSTSETRENVRSAISQMFGFEKFHRDHFTDALFAYNQIFIDGFSHLKLSALQAINGCIHFDDKLAAHFPNIFTTVDLALRTDGMQTQCFLIWSTFFECLKKNENERDKVPGMFGPVLTQVLPFFKDHPSEIKDFIGGHAFTSCSNIGHVNSIIISDSPEFQGIMSDLQCNNEEYDDERKLKLLSEQLGKSSPSYSSLLLDNILRIVRKRPVKMPLLVERLWRFAQDRCTDEQMVTIGRCLSYIQYTSDAKPPDSRPLDSNNEPSDKDIHIIKYMIQNHLYPMLIDTPHHMTAAYAIHNLLIELHNRGYSDEQIAAEFGEGDLWTFVSPFAKQNFIAKQNNRGKLKLYDNFPYTLILRMMEDQSIEEDGTCSYFKAVLCACAVSEPLCRFVFKYLCKLNLKKPSFKSKLQRLCVKILKNDSNSPQVIAAQNFLLSSERVLGSFKITLSSLTTQLTYDQNSELEKIGVPHEDLYRAAVKNKHYALAVRSFDLMKKGGLETQEEKVIMHDIMDRMNDIDAVQYLEETIYNKDDRTVQLDEFTTMEKCCTDCSILIRGLDEEFKQGKFRRVLRDGYQYSSIWPHNPHLCDIIARTSLMLGDWDKLSFVSETTIDSSEANPMELFRIGAAKSLLYLRGEKKELFNQQLIDIRKQLAVQLKDAATRSYLDLYENSLLFKIVEDIERTCATKKLPKPIEESNKAHMSMDLIEFSASLQSALLQLTLPDVRNPSNEVQNQLKDLWRNLAHACRKDNQLAKAEQYGWWAVSKCTDENEECSFEVAKIYRDNGNYKAAFAAIDNSVNISTRHDENMLAKMEISKTVWAKETENVQMADLIATFEKNIPKLTEPAKEYYRFAIFCDEGFFNYLNQIKNDEGLGVLDNKISFYDRPQKEIYHQFLVTRLKDALTNYIRAIDKNESLSNEIIPRLLTIFFDTGTDLINGIMENKVNERLLVMTMIDVMATKLSTIPAFVWASNMTQLISRVNVPKPLRATLIQMIHEALKMYPELSLWNLMYIVNSDSIGCKEIRDDVFSPVQDTPIYDTFVKLTNSLKSIAYFTKKDISKSEWNPYEEVPNEVEIINSCKVMVPSQRAFSIKSEENRPKIECIEPQSSIFHSKMQPKQLKIRSNDGNIYEFMCKQDTDMRKDMRMMEFCSFINHLFNNDRRCRSRQLSMTTYNVVCLSEHVGVMEMIKNVKPFISIIPKQNQRIARSIFSNAKSKIDAIIKIHNEIPPNTKNWFAFMFADPEVWYKAQLAYIRSTAAWSMVGYIVGLGDRHLNNILLKEKTGEVAHVDFDLIFGKGKNLQFPEKVPFRLTPIIADGLGPTGVEGSFLKVSTLILEVLRQRREKLVNQLKPFAQDPLLEWGHGADISEFGKVGAHDMLMEVDRRLKGQAKDGYGVISPEFNARHIFKQAQDIRNLSVMFQGWCPFF